MFGSLLKAAAAVVDVPVAAARDVVTMAGQAFGEEPNSGTHTGDALGRFVGNIKDATDPDK
jgi:hypothetical protein